MLRVSGYLFNRFYSHISLGDHIHRNGHCIWVYEHIQIRSCSKSQKHRTLYPSRYVACGVCFVVFCDNVDYRIADTGREETISYVLCFGYQHPLIILDSVLRRSPRDFHRVASRILCAGCSYMSGNSSTLEQ